MILSADTAVSSSDWNKLDLCSCITAETYEPFCSHTFQINK